MSKSDVSLSENQELNRQHETLISIKDTSL